MARNIENNLSEVALKVLSSKRKVSRLRVSWIAEGKFYRVNDFRYRVRSLRFDSYIG